MISYAQNHEDVLLDRAFPRGRHGFYIDVGANDPVEHSITKHFYDLGWHGVNVEPTPHLIERFGMARARDVNLNVGVAGKPGTATFYEFPPALSGISTFSLKEADRHRDAGYAYVERTVPTITLGQLCEEYVHGPIDFLSIDVEGYEREVIEGGDWTRWRPRVVVVEACQPLTNIAAHEAWEPLLLEADYSFACFDGLNRFYVRSEDAELVDILRVPVNVTDDYVDHGSTKQIRELTMAYDTVSSQLLTARALNENVLGQYHCFAEELDLLRARYEKLDRTLTNRQADHEAMRRLASDTEGLVEAARSDVAEASARFEAVKAYIGDLGPGSLGAVRRLSRVARRYPGASARLKKGLLAGLRLKRALAKRSG